MIGTKHDVIHELFEMHDLIASGSAPDAILPRLRLPLQWVQEDISAMHALAHGPPNRERTGP